ncbi:MAG: RluA family pseudouridine synthase, partial [Cyanobacteria bacterium P01_H01_bin.121]
QPIMGFLLVGATAALPQPVVPAADQGLAILYEDADLIVVDKPASLLSVPGRTRDRQDSVFSRLRCQYPNGEYLQTVHRLDQETSGVLLVARTPAAYQALSEQFRRHQVQKYYEAIVVGELTSTCGRIALPLWGQPQNRPQQSVNLQRGKASYTDYRVLDVTAGHTRLELHPLTGRTHQLRVHAADSLGLGAPILGDRLYGLPITTSLGSSEALSTRLHLHATSLNILLPSSAQRLQFKSHPPF